MPISAKTLKRFLILAALVFAGEMVFSLPFHVTRFFRPMVLSVFELSNADLGDVFALYGLTAMLAYFPGGTIADHLSARKAMAFSLFLTALGGVYMAQIPDRTGLMALFAYWGVTSIFLFWAAMIKATRQWGAEVTQGRAFGVLDGGRGLVAAGVASIAVFILTVFLPADLETVAAPLRRQALQQVIYFYTFVTFGAAMVIWLCVPESNQEKVPVASHTFSGIKRVVTTKVVWLQAIIVVSAYCGYKGLDNYALYALDVLQMTELEAARFTASAAYLRPVAAIAAGFLADRILASRVIAGGFAMLIATYAVLALGSPSLMAVKLLYGNVLLTFCAVFAIRGVYFALLEETKIPGHLTGTAVGLVSVLGFTPDIFFAPMAGRILDADPGLIGHQHYFVLLLIFAVIGLAATLLLTSVMGKVQK